MITNPNEKLLELLLSQYYNSTNFIKYLQVFTDMNQDIHEMLLAVEAQRMYDVAAGVQLDIVGDLVGASSRTLQGIAALDYFGYVGATESNGEIAIGAGTDADRTIGGFFDSDTGPITEDLPLNDLLYRQWIAARIIKNSARCTIEDIILFIQTLLGNFDLDVEVTEPTAATIHIQIHNTLGLVEKPMFEERAGHIKPTGVTMTAEDNNGTITIRTLGH